MTGAYGGVHAPEDVLLALADPVRRQIIAALVRDGDATSTSLAAPLPVTRQAVAKHLAVLERAGLVRGRRAGREVRYTADLQPLRRTTRWLDTLAEQWEGRLRSIKALAEEDAEPSAGETDGP
ncbi:ArsR/SmtB family transcription factor [Streptomyces gilvus]|uniref:ArsR/SmtB family transcription factor n=1 Tax=Streptomyces gilvus TaxID=2920937 RepID=UPI001F0ECCAC|nr:metalloregulator ArsR/SmtB family transcription factor [Streptomyces sp. CME 23]MCH5671916.1 metalloregulator ArsR/SmtB family transcription factor [Streptomyces sp. CME 23]